MTTLAVTLPSIIGGFFAMPFFLFGAILVLIVLGAIFGSKQAEQRRQALRTWGQGRGLSFDPARDTSFDDRFAHFAAFGRGHSRSAYNTLRGHIELNRRPHGVLTGDFLYKTTSTDSKGRTRTTTHRLSYLIVQTPYPALPEVLIRRENFFDKIAGVVGFDDIDFEDAEFSKRFHVKSKDRRFAYDLCSPQVIEYIKAALPDAPTIEVDRGEVLFLHGVGRWRPAEFERVLRFAEGFIDRWPDHMLAEREGDSSFRTGIETPGGTEA